MLQYKIFLCLLFLCGSLLQIIAANVGFSLGGRAIPNHGLVYFEDIGVDPNAADLSVGLACWTNATSDVCCEDNNPLSVCGRRGGCSSGSGSWIFPHIYSETNTDLYIRRQMDGLTGNPQVDGYGIHRDGNAVYLFRNRNITVHPGLWRCVIPDTSGKNQTLFIGIYPRQEASGTVSAQQSGLHYSLISSEDPLMFTLTLNTSGGPATYVTWTRDGVEITTLSDVTYSTTRQPVIDLVRGRGYRSARYTNILTVTGRHPGVYKVNVTNDRNNQPVLRTITLVDISPTNFTITRTGLTSVRVFWTLPSDTTTHLSGYEVNATYVNCSDECQPVADVRTVDASKQTIVYHNIQLWSKLHVTISCIPLSGNFFLPLNFVQEPAHYTLKGLYAVDNVSAQLLNATSVMVTWAHPDQGLSVDEYIVSYQRINGTDGQCSTEQDEGEMSVDGNHDHYNVMILLKAFSIYTVTITTMNNVYSVTNVSSPFQFSTNSAAPTQPPRNLTITNMTTTSITITWKSVECIHRNGLITHYLVQHEVVGGRILFNISLNITETEYENGNYMFSSGGLNTSEEEYIIKVAAVNVNGIGPFAQQMFGDSSLESDEAGDHSAVAAGVTVTLILVLSLVITSVIVIAIMIMYRKRNGMINNVKPTLCLNQSSNSTTHYPDMDMSNFEILYDKTHYGNSFYEPTLEKKSVKAKEFPPKIVQFPEDIHVTEGQEVVLEVTVSGQPEPSLTWYHNGEELVADYSQEIDQDGRVYIPSSEQRHSGVYKLVVKNERGSDKREMTVFVQDENEAEAAIIDVRPITVDEFGVFVSKHHKDFNAGFRELYQGLYKGEDRTKNIGLSPANKKLNRFGNITVYDDNRIVLKPSNGFHNTFVNACYVDGYQFPQKYIATQGPIAKTVKDFWRLVWQENVPTIVMVTNLKEGEKEKCQQYWPDSGSCEYGNIEVTITDQQILADYVIRSFLVKVNDEQSAGQLKVTQYHFTSWPDHGVPTYATSILAYHRRVETEHKPRAKKGPMLVHCSAGVGRTGTFIAIDWVLEQVEKEKIVDIAGTVNKMRQQRMKMVQTVEQFMFIHDAILESVTCGNTQINVADLRSVVGKMQRRDSKTNKTMFELHFDVLDQVSPSPQQCLTYCTTAMNHRERNRFMEYLPSENNRVILKGEFPDYIHATNVNGYRKKNAYIIAEGPMESTVRNFWKMICDRKCGAIIMLSDIIEHGVECSFQYWPSSSVTEAFGDCDIKLIKEDQYDGYTTRQLSASLNKEQPHEVMQFHITNWGVDGNCSDLSSITEVIEKVTKAQMRSGNKPIVVHCSDTVGRSCMFCAISSAIEQCKSEGVVDVFQVIKVMRVQKPGAVLNVEQYQLVYDVVMIFLDSFDMYANFQQM